MQHRKYTTDVLKYGKLQSKCYTCKNHTKWESSYEGEAMDSTLFKQIVGSLDISAIAGLIYAMQLF